MMYYKNHGFSEAPDIGLFIHGNRNTKRGSPHGHPHPESRLQKDLISHRLNQLRGPLPLRVDPRGFPTCG